MMSPGPQEVQFLGIAVLIIESHCLSGSPLRSLRNGTYGPIPRGPVFVWRGTTSTRNSNHATPNASGPVPLHADHRERVRERLLAYRSNPARHRHRAVH